MVSFQLSLERRLNQAYSDTRPTIVRHRLGTERLAVLGFISAFGFLALGACVLFEARRDAWHQAEQASTNLTIALARDISRNISAFDLSIRGVVEAMQTPGIELATEGVRKHALYDRSAMAEDLGSLTIIDRNGGVVDTSAETPSSQLNFADRDYFQVHQNDATRGLYISHPYQSRMRPGNWAVALSRRVDDDQGRFAGIIAGSLQVNYFKRLFERLDLGPQGSISLLLDDGTVIARYPFREADIGRDLGRGDTFRAIMNNVNGLVVATAQVDGVERLYSIRRIGELPLVISVNTSVEDIYANWRHRALVIGSILIALSSAVGGCFFLFRRELRHRLALEGQLRESAAKFAVLAATDGLTGLASRRALDAGYWTEWRRAARYGTPLAVLMLDIDYFKQFNDRYGHIEGDRVLRDVAQCMQDQVLRPGDLVGRFGGEEFMIVLPKTDANGAVNVAERIRKAVADLAVPHAASEFGEVTLSVGLAVLVPTPKGASDALINAADKALYEAKSAGRNCVQLARDTTGAATLAA